jgi:hypothetical protein
MLRSIRAGETFIVWDEDGTPAATITVDRWVNPDLWTPRKPLSRRCTPTNSHRTRLCRPGPWRRATRLGRGPRRCRW